MGRPAKQLNPGDSPAAYFGYELRVHREANQLTQDELADKLQIKGGDKIKVISARSTYYAKALVTSRVKPMKLAGKGDELTYQVGIPIHWGYKGLGDGRPENERTPVNLLSPTVIDPNAYTPEFKGFLVKIEKA